MEFIQSLHWSVWIVIPIVGLAIRDILQKKHTIQHNFPVIGHIRYMLETIGPELRQYIVANNREELPFNRGEMLIIPRASITELDIPSSDAMKMIISGGVSLTQDAK